MNPLTPERLDIHQPFCVTGNKRSPMVKGALGLLVSPGNTLERTKGTLTYPMSMKLAPVLGSPPQEVTSRFHRMFLILDGLLGPAGPPKKKNAIDRVKQLIDVDALMLLHVDDHNHQQDIQREIRSGEVREGRFYIQRGYNCASLIEWLVQVMSSVAH